jgi:hypothetical protein
MGSKLTQKTTIYLEPRVKKYLQLRSLQTSNPISKIINEHFEFEIKRFKAYGGTPKGRDHPSIAEWKIIETDLDSRR